MSHYSDIDENRRKEAAEEEKRYYTEKINKKIEKLYYKDLIIIDKFIEKLESVKGVVEIIETITRS